MLDLETLDKCQSARKILDEKIDVANRSITSLIFEKDEKEEALQMAKKKADEALASKDDAMALPQKCNEFKRLSEELSNCQKRSEELSRRRRDLLSELYLCQQEFMKKDSYMKTIQSSTAISGSQAMKTGNDIGCAKGSSADESHSNRRVVHKRHVTKFFSNIRGFQNTPLSLLAGALNLKDSKDKKLSILGYLHIYRF
eukprot:gene10723-19501_t